MFRCHIKASEQPRPVIRISMVLQANETQDLPLWGFVNLVLKPHKYEYVAGILPGQSLHKYAYITALHFVKHGRADLHQNRRCHHRKNWRYKQQLSYRKIGGFPSDQPVDF